MRSTRLPFVFAVWIGLLSGRSDALTGRENLEQLNAKLDRYGALAQSRGPKELKEAQSILDSFKKLIRMPAYMGGVRWSHDPAMGDVAELKDQIQFIKTLLGGMVSNLQGAAFNSPYSAAQKEAIKETYMGERTTVTKLLNSMQQSLSALVKSAGKQPAPAPAPQAIPAKAEPKPESPRETEATGSTPRLLR